MPMTRRALLIVALTGCTTDLPEFDKREATDPTVTLLPDLIYTDSSVTCVVTDTEGITDLGGTWTAVWLVNEVEVGPADVALDGSSFVKHDEVGCEVRALVGGQEVDPTTTTEEVLNSLPVLAVTDLPYTGLCLTEAADGTLLADATDADGDPLTVRVGDEPTTGALTVSAAGGLVWAADALGGSDSFTLYVADDEEEAGPFTVTLTDRAGDHPILVDVASDAAEDGLCSLREAVDAAATDAAVDGCSAGQGADAILFEPGLRPLALSGEPGDDANLGGDLDLSGELSVLGCGATEVVIDLAGVDRAFDVQEGAVVDIRDLAILGGLVVGEPGGAVLNRGTLTLAGVEISGSESVGVDGERGPIASGDAYGGGGGGGGSAGMGGAVYNAGVLTLDDGIGPCHVRANRAVGGQGGTGNTNGGQGTGVGGAGGGFAGGAGGDSGPGQDGGFSSGGGGGAGDWSTDHAGGAGGFGGGGGGGGASTGGGVGGPGGGSEFGGGLGGQEGCSAGAGGGGGAGMGAGVFNHEGELQVLACVFESNLAEGGGGGGNPFGCGPRGEAGGGYGGAIFELDGTLDDAGATYLDNLATEQGNDLLDY